MVLHFTFLFEQCPGLTKQQVNEQTQPKRQYFPAPSRNMFLISVTLKYESAPHLDGTNLSWQ